MSFEIRKFDADKPKREREIAKLDEELRELRRPWYRKSSSLPTIVVAIVAGILAFGTDVFKSNVVTLKRERDQLVKNVKDLSTQKAKLANNNSVLSQDEDRLGRRVSILTKQKGALSQEILVTELKTDLRTIQSAGEFDLDLSNPSLEDLLVVAKQDKGNVQAIQTLQSAYDAAFSSQRVKAALCLALFLATENTLWKERLRQLSLDGISSELRSSNTLRFWVALRPPPFGPHSIYLELLKEPSVFAADEKVATLRQLYETVLASPASNLPLAFPSTQTDDPVGVLADWDEDATVGYRDPWFDYLRHLYELYESEHSNQPLFNQTLRVNAFTLQFYSPEAYGIRLIKSFAEQDTDRTVETGVYGGDNDCSPFPSNFPLCAQWIKVPQAVQGVPDLGPFHLTRQFVLSTANIAAYRKWLSANQDLVNAWTDPSFSRLRQCNDATMRRIFRREWVDALDARKEGLP